MTDDAKGELLPCPFCGSAAHMVHLTELPDDDPNFGGAYVECTNANCAATTNIHFGEYNTILREKWNRRASAAPWSGPPPIVSDEIADISLACTPAASAEDAPVALHTRLREMSDHMLNATALTGAELIHMSIAMTESAAELDRLTAANAALQARVEAAELDAKRYRWLRENNYAGRAESVLAIFHGDGIDNCIDAAMGADKGAAEREGR